MADDSSTNDRILACLRGLASGDAIGKQTETLSRADIRRWYPNGIRGFEDPPGVAIPRYATNSKRRWRVGETTDDTERTIAVARALLHDRRASHTTVGREMLACGKSVHPGVASLWEFHQAGDPARVADRHDGCGAAVRVAPVGILYRPDRLADIVEAARQVSIPTHGGPLALAAAAATAAAVSAAVEGWSGSSIFDLASDAAVKAEHQRSGTRSFAEAMHRVRAAIDRTGDLEPDAIAARAFPTDPLTIVPLAIALATRLDSAAQAILLAANVGGDSDSVASIAGAILGARQPDSIDHGWHAVVEQVNSHGLEELAARLCHLRQRGEED